MRSARSITCCTWRTTVAMRTMPVATSVPRRDGKEVVSSLNSHVGCHCRHVLTCRRSLGQPSSTQGRRGHVSSTRQRSLHGNNYYATHQQRKPHARPHVNQWHPNIDEILWHDDTPTTQACTLGTHHAIRDDASRYAHMYRAEQLACTQAWCSCQCVQRRVCGLLAQAQPLMIGHLAQHAAPGNPKVVQQTYLATHTQNKGTSRYTS